MSGKWDPLTDMPNLEGKVVVVTGGKYVVDPTAESMHFF